MKRDARLYLDDILESIQAIEDYTQGVTQQQFDANRLLQDSVAHLPACLTALRMLYYP